MKDINLMIVENINEEMGEVVWSIIRSNMGELYPNSAIVSLNFASLEDAQKNFDKVYADCLKAWGEYKPAVKPPKWAGQ